MKVYALWHGGTNYANGYVDTDVELFDTLADAVAAFRERLSSNMYSPVDFPYVNRPAERVCAGMVDEMSTMRRGTVGRCGGDRARRHENGRQRGRD